MGVKANDTIIYKNMKYTFNFTPITTVTDANGEQHQVPHLFDMPASKYLAEQLLNKVNTDTPELDYRMANELQDNGSVELNDEELIYFKQFITSLPVDNLYKGQLLDALNETKI